MAYVAFNQKLSFAQISQILTTITEGSANYSIKNGDVLTDNVIGVSDGRYVAPNTLCFIEKPPAIDYITRLKSAVIITNATTASALQGCTMLVVNDPRASYIDVINEIITKIGFHCFSDEVTDDPLIHPTATVHPQAVIEADVYIGPYTRIAAGCVIKRGTHIGAEVTIRENTVIGCDGIALYKTLDNRVLRFPHLAGVLIEDCVEIGASCVLPRGVLTSTKIGRDSVIGNLTNIGHAVNIGQKVWMSVGCLIGGNTSIGDHATLGLGAVVRDNLRIGKGCAIGMGAVVVNDLANDSAVFGNPARKLPSLNTGPKR